MPVDTDLRTSEPVRVPKRVAGVLINSLKGGVVPRIDFPILPWAGSRRSKLCSMILIW